MKVFFYVSIEKNLRISNFEIRTYINLKNDIDLGMWFLLDWLVLAGIAGPNVNRDANHPIPVSMCVVGPIHWSVSFEQFGLFFLIIWRL